MAEETAEAVETEESAPEETAADTVEEQQEETPVEESTEETPVAGATDAELEEAKQFLQRLKTNPQAVANEIFSAAGMQQPQQQQQQQAPQQAPEAPLSSSDIMKAELGDNYSIIADKFGKAIDKIIEQRVVPHVAQSQQMTVQQQVQYEIDSFRARHNLQGKEGDAVLDQMEVLGRGMSRNDMPMAQYLDNLYILTGKAKAPVSRATQVNKMQAAQASQTPRAASANRSTKKQPAPKSIRESIELALSDLPPDELFIDE